MKIRHNKPYLSGQEIVYIGEAVEKGRLSGNQSFTKKCQQFFASTYGFEHNLLTTSCTDALEMSALLLDIQPGDEVIMPTFTFVSTANAFILRGAKIVFADSYAHHPNIDPSQVEALITPRTKAIVLVHYAGVACDMDAFTALAEKHDIAIIEDAAQAIDSTYNGKPLGSLGTIAAFSFHETKNIICGEGGLLVINDEKYQKRSEIIWEKGTNRTAFYRGEVDKYGWVDVGSSFLPSDMLAAFLYAQLENMEYIQQRRIAIWNNYFKALQPLADAGNVELPNIPSYATNNGHIFYLVCNNETERDNLIAYLKSKSIHAVFHYLTLHDSAYFHDKHDGRHLAHAERFTKCLVRLPLYVELSADDQQEVIDQVLAFYKMG